MAAYASAVSLMHIIDLIENHPSPPISLDKKQLHSLTQVVNFLQEFLEGYVSPFSYSDEADPLEMRIVDAVYAAEDVIESYIFDKIHHAGGTTHDDDKKVGGGGGDNNDGEQIRYIKFYEGLEKVIEVMNLIKKEAMGIVRNKGGLKAQLPSSVAVEAGFKSSSIERMVGFEDELLQLLDRLTGGDSDRQIIPIVGMGGMGKTTLARNVFADQLINEHFDICLWGTISQDFKIENTLKEILSQGKGHSIDDKSVAELGQDLHKYLFGKRYLVVLDDLWSIEVWDKIRNFFPDCGKRSRIIVTSRMSNLAAHLTSSGNSLCMSFLNEVDSWTLFSETVFGSEGSVPELREIGEKIVGKCKGLPLSIVVIGGLLARSERTQGYWEHIEGNLSSIVNLEKEEYCLKVLKLSYNHLPAYLKPCFLYMGVFDEDSEIRVSTVIKLWVSEGFVKPRKKKTLDVVAREYFQELVDRNLLLPVADGDEVESRWRDLMDRKLGWAGMTKFCRVHDLVRDVSLREAQKQRFYYVYSQEHNPLSSHFRIVIHKDSQQFHGEQASKSWPNHRSYLCNDTSSVQFQDFRLLRTVHTPYHKNIQKDVFGLVNSRLLAIAVEVERLNNVLDSSISRLWSLHTLIVYCGYDLKGPVEFWSMHQLKHVEFTGGRLRLQLPPPNNGNSIVILENLHTLIGMEDFYLTEDVVRRIPNLRILDVNYEEKKMNREVHCFSYLGCLSKLESFRCSTREENLQRICFPQSLVQIILIDDIWASEIELEDVMQKIGGLPSVEELGIRGGVFRRGEWATIEGQFPRLRTLEMVYCGSLVNWTVSEASHFPLLQKLVFHYLVQLEEIPSEIGEISTLRSVELRHCSESAMLSAGKIVEEQEEFHGEELLSFRVLVEARDEELLESLASPNIQVELRESH